MLIYRLGKLILVLSIAIIVFPARDSLATTSTIPTTDDSLQKNNNKK